MLCIVAKLHTVDPLDQVDDYLEWPALHCISTLCQATRSNIAPNVIKVWTRFLAFSHMVYLTRMCPHDKYWSVNMMKQCLMFFNHFTSVDVYTSKTFPNCKTEDVYIHVLRHYSINSYSILGDPGQKALQTMIEPTLFVDFCLIPLSNTCSFVRLARNVNRDIFLHCQEGFCVGKFGRMVDQAVLDNRPLRKHFRRYRLRYKRQALLKI